MDKNKLFHAFRTYRFEASHSENLPEIIIPINKQYEIYGKGIHPHGHNFKMIVGVKGPKDPDTGMIIELGKLDTIVNELIVDKFDHYYINDLPMYSISDGVILTLEWLAGKCYKLLENNPIVGTLLNHIRLYDTPNSYIIIERNSPMILKTQIFEFNAQHKLFNPDFSEEQNNNAFGKCVRLHGHNYSLKVVIAGKLNKDTKKLVVDHKFTNLVNSILENYDYTNLHDIENIGVATTESFIEHLWEQMGWQIKKLGINCPYSSDDLRLAALQLHETSRNSFVYTGPRNEIEMVLDLESIEEME